MRQVVWASMRVHARRYVATVVAVVMGVGFIVATDVVSSAARDGLLAEAAAQYAGSGTVVSDVPDVRTADRVLARTPGTASVNAQANEPISVDGRVVADTAVVGSVSTASVLQWQRLVAGAFPTGVGQAVADRRAAGADGVGLGDRVTIGRGRSAREVRVTGLVAPATGTLAAPLYVTWADLSALRDSAYVQDVVTTAGDVSAVRAALPSRLVVEATDTYLQGVQAEATQGVDVIAALLLVFAGIAFFVSALVIANTFAILLAQRARDFALLRCVGATRRQVRRSVLAESTVMGVGSATVGVLAGTAAGYALLALAGRLFPSLPAGDASVSPVWVAGAWLLGVLVTVLASLAPTLKGPRVSPLAALRPDAAVAVRSATGAARLVLAAVFLLGGTLLLAGSVRTHDVLLLLAGGMVSFLGVLLVGPLLVPACVRLLGRVVGRFGVPGRVAAANAVRNPRRTAATAASLLVGVTLVSGLLTGMATVRSSVDSELDHEYPVDLALAATRGPLQADAVDRVRAVDGVRAAVALQGTLARVRSGRHDLGAVPLVGVDPDATAVLRGSPSFASPEPGVLHLPWRTLEDAGVQDGARAAVVVGDVHLVLVVRGTEGLSSTGAVAPSTLEALTHGDTRPLAIWARTDRDADAADVAGVVTRIGWPSHAELWGGLKTRASVHLQLTVVTGAVVAMLGIGVLIALVGIASTLGLSVLERAREHAVLRALGLTRTQLRGMLAAEAVLLATVAGLLGVVLGAVYAWVGVRAVVGEAFDGVTTTLPVTQLVLLVVLAALAGLGACVLPARQASRVAPAAGLGAD